MWLVTHPNGHAPVPSATGPSVVQGGREPGSGLRVQPALQPEPWAGRGAGEQCQSPLLPVAAVAGAPGATLDHGHEEGSAC